MKRTFESELETNVKRLCKESVKEDVSNLKRRFEEIEANGSKRQRLCHHKTLDTTTTREPISEPSPEHIQRMRLLEDYERHLSTRSVILVNTVADMLRLEFDKKFNEFVNSNTNRSSRYVF